MSNLGVAAKGMAWTTVSTIVRSLVSMLQVAILTRYLSTADFGIVAIATVFIGFSQIFLDMGISIGIMHKQDITKNQYSSLYWLNIITGVILMFLLMAVSPVLSKFYEEPSLTPVLLLLSTSMLFSAIGNQHRIVQQKMLRFKLISLVEISGSLLTIAVAIVLCVLGQGIYSLVFSTLFNVLYINLAFLIIGLRQDKNISFHFNIRDTYPFLKISIFSLGTQILDYFSREIDVIIISTTLGKDVLGIYTLCKKLIIALYNAVNPILMKVMTPILAKMQGDVKKLQQVYYDIIESLAIINFPIYCLVAIFSFAILNFVYGYDYTEASITLSLLALHYGYLTIGNPVGALQTALGRTDSGFYWTICRIILYTGAVYLGSFGSIERIVLFLLFTSILSQPLSWKITIHPLIGGKFWDYFRIGFIPYILTIVYSFIFYVCFSSMLNIWLCSLVAITYLIIYILVCFATQKDTYLFFLISKAVERYKLKRTAYNRS